MAAKVINEENFVGFYSTCAPETYSNLTKQLGGLAVAYKIQNNHMRRSDSAVFEEPDHEKVLKYSLGLLKAIKWAGKHNGNGLLTQKQISWEDDDILGIEELALDIYTDIVTSEKIIEAIRARV